MAKKRSSRNNSRRANNRSSGSGFFDTINSKFSSDKNYTYMASLLGFVLLVALMNTGSSGNQITGAAIEDVTGNAIGEMLKDFVGVIVGPDGIIATVFVNLTTGANWLPAVAVVMLVSVMFYLLLKKGLFKSDEHKKALFLLSLSLGLLSIGVTIEGQSLVNWFKDIIETTVLLTVVLVAALAGWIFALWGYRRSSKQFTKTRERRREGRMQEIGSRKNLSSAQDDADWERSTRAQQVQINRLIATNSARYKNARTNRDKKIIENEFRTQAAEQCPDIDAKDILSRWKAAIR